LPPPLLVVVVVVAAVAAAAARDRTAEKLSISGEDRRLEAEASAAALGGREERAR